MMTVFFARVKNKYFCTANRNEDLSRGRFTENVFNNHLVLYDSIFDLLQQNEIIRYVDLVVESLPSKEHDIICNHAEIETWLIGTKEGLCATPLAMRNFGFEPVLFVEKTAHNHYYVTNLPKGKETNDV